MTSNWTRRTFHAAVAATALIGSAVFAQGYPTRPVTIVVPFTPGSSPDVLARDLAQFLSKKLNRTVIVDNKPGAGTMIASRFVADAPPDGYTLFFNGSSSMLAPEVNPATRGKNYMRDMTYVSPVAIFPNAIQVSAELPVRTLAEY